MSTQLKLMKSFKNPKINEIIAQSSPSLSDKNLEKGKSLGSGTLGDIKQIISKETFALKRIDLTKLVQDLDDEGELYERLSCAFSEFQIMRKNYPNVVRSYLCHFNPENYFFSFTMDLMRQGDLGSLIQKKSLPFERCYKLFKDLVTGKKIIAYNNCNRKERIFFLKIFLITIIIPFFLQVCTHSSPRKK